MQGENTSQCRPLASVFNTADAVLWRKSRRNTNCKQHLDPLVEKYQALIRAADEIVFICPIWWSSLSAMSKGFLDKVMKQKFAYIPERTGPRGLLTHIKTAVLITTSTTPNFAFALLLGNPIKCVFVKVVMKQLGFQKREWLNFGGISGFHSRQAA